MPVKFLTDEAEGVNTLQFFHINLNCKHLERSIDFYRLMGFRIVNEFEHDGPTEKAPTFAEIGLGPILGLPDDCEARAVLMALTDDPRGIRLDLIEWKIPQSQMSVQTNLAQIGFGRICLKLRDAWAMHRKLQAAGHASYSEPILITMGGSRQWVFCCNDPDGVVIEFMQFVRDGTPAATPQ